MDGKTRRLFDILIFTSIIVITIITVISNYTHFVLIIIYSILFIASFVSRHLLFGKKYGLAGKLTFLTDIILIYLITSQDLTKVWEVYFFVEIIDAVTLCPFLFGIFYVVLNYSSYILIKYIRYIKYNYFEWKYFSQFLYDNLFMFLFIFVFTFIVNQQILQKKLLSEAMKELKIKTDQLEISNKKLKETMETLEAMTVLKERNRIAREIHDTVGHTLTTVLVEMEAGKRLMKRKQELAAEKIELAQDQVRKGLNAIRCSVRALQDGSELLPSQDAINLLIADTEKHASVSVKKDISLLPELAGDQWKIIYSALQEGLTNGIRHGRCSGFYFRLECAEDTIFFLLEDNGVGCGEISLGFGLTSMKERAENSGGKFVVHSAPGRGCRIELQLPVCKKEAEVSDTRIIG
ncbi:MAG: sensor histidine kinase [Clostridiaceae bacterium]